MDPNLGSSDLDHAIPSFHYQVCTSVHPDTDDDPSVLVDVGAPVEDADVALVADAAQDEADADLVLVLAGAAPAVVDEDLVQVPALADEAPVADAASVVRVAAGAAAPDADAVQDRVLVLGDAADEVPA